MPDRNAKGWTVEREQRRVTRKECKRLREEVEVGNFKNHQSPTAAHVLFCMVTHVASCLSPTAALSSPQPSSLVAAYRSHTLLTKPSAPKAADNLLREAFCSIMAVHPALVTFDSFLAARPKSWQFLQRLIVCGVPSLSTQKLKNRSFFHCTSCRT